MDTVAVVTGLVTAITAMSGFIVYLIKRYLDDMKAQYEDRLSDQEKQIAKADQQIERWQVVAERNADTAKDSLTITRDLREMVARMDRELIERGGRRATDRHD